MSKQHSLERARKYKEQYRAEKAAATKNEVHWGGFFITLGVLLVIIGTLFGLGFVGLPFLGGSAILAFFIGYVVGVYGWSVRKGAQRYDYASVFGIVVGIIFVILNLIPYTAFGSILLSLAGASGIYATMISLGTFGVLFLYLFFGFVSTKESKV